MKKRSSIFALGSVAVIIITFVLLPSRYKQAPTSEPTPQPPIVGVRPRQTPQASGSAEINTLLPDGVVLPKDLMEK